MNGSQGSKHDKSSVPDVSQSTGTEKRRLTQERVRELFDYDAESGNLIRRVKQKGSKGIGSIAGYIGKRGYNYVSIDNIRYRTHRIIWLWHYGYTPENNVDHINRIKTDNRIENLREINQSCNLRNACIRSDNKTGVRGIRLDRRDKIFYSSIKADMKDNYLYGGKDFTEAVAHRLAAEQCLEWEDCDTESTAYQYIQKYLQELKCQKN